MNRGSKIIDSGTLILKNINNIIMFYPRDLLSLGAARPPPKLVKGAIVTARYPKGPGSSEGTPRGTRSRRRVNRQVKVPIK